MLKLNVGLYFHFFVCVCVSRFGRKLAVIRGEVEREIQALVSKRDNVHTHHPYHAWDPVPSLSAASAGNAQPTHTALQPISCCSVTSLCNCLVHLNLFQQAL